jgi:hypothetical protein
LYAARGSYNSWGDTSSWRLVGDTANGGVSVSPVFTTYSMHDSRWKETSYAGTSYKIGGTNGQGCALTSLAMALTGAGIAQDPGALNSLLLSSNNGYTKIVDGDGKANAYVNWDIAVSAAAKAAGLADKVTFQTGGTRSSSTAVLDNLLSNGYPVIVGVNPHVDSQGKTEWWHFVVVTGKQGSTYTITDPGRPERTTLDAYSNVFETRGYVKDPIDVSRIAISVGASGSGVNLLLVDSDGNKTGIDGSNGRFELIPGSVHFIDALTDLESTESATSVSQYIQVEHPELGDYNIEIRGIDASSTSYSLLETAFAPDGTQLWCHEISGIIAAGSVDQYSFTYAVPEPSSFVLFIVGSVSLLAYAWRRRRQMR